VLCVTCACWPCTRATGRGRSNLRKNHGNMYTSRGPHRGVGRRLRHLPPPPPPLVAVMSLAWLVTSLAKRGGRPPSNRECIGMMGVLLMVQVVWVAYKKPATDRDEEMGKGAGGGVAGDKDDRTVADGGGADTTEGLSTSRQPIVIHRNPLLPRQNGKGVYTAGPSVQY